MTRCKILLLGTVIVSLLGGLQSHIHAAILPTVGAAVVYHIDAGTLGLSEGDPVSSWAANVGPNASQGTSGNQPVFRASVTPLGTDGVEFDQADDHMDLASIIPDFESIFFVVQYLEFGQQQMIIGGDVGAGHKLGHRTGSIFIDGVNVSGHPFSSTDFTAHAWQQSGPWLENSVDKGGTTLNQAFAGGIVLGAERSAIHTFGADNLGPAAVMVEIVAYDGQLNAADRLAVSDYLLHKHIVPIPEPSTLGLLALGGLTLLSRRRSL